jgi:two-component system response regulator WspF
MDKIRSVRRMRTEERARSAATSANARATTSADALNAMRSASAAAPAVTPAPTPAPAAERHRAHGTTPPGAMHHAHGAPAATPAQPADTQCPIVAVGSSTGGPQALATLISSLPNPLPFAVAIVQHMDASFLPGLATWLASHTGRDVRLARRGDRPGSGTILVAGEPKQMVLTAEGAIDYVEGNPDLIHRPSVDAFFESLARNRSRRGVAVLLTGMGRDGATGMLAMRGQGWRTLAQDKATSVVWGMPGAASEIGAAERVLPLNEIGPAVVATLRAATGGAR